MDIQRRADDEAWDKRVDRRISHVNQSVEKGLRGKALAALHGLPMLAEDELAYEVDGSSDVDDQETLRSKVFRRLIQIEDAISQNRDLPEDTKRKWIAILQECYPGEANSVVLLYDLKRDMNCWQEIDSESELSLLQAAIDAAGTMTEIYQRRFRTR